MPPRLSLPRLASLRRPAAAALLLLALVGCSRDVRFAPACPRLALLADAADLTRFVGTGRDVTDVLMEGHIFGVDASCKPGRAGEVAATMRVQIQFGRGPAARSRTVDAPYFIAVTLDNNVVDRRDFVIRASFPSNVEQVMVTGDEVNLSFPASPDRSAAAYKIFVGFQLTEAELAYNRRNTLP